MDTIIMIYLSIGALIGLVIVSRYIGATSISISKDAAPIPDIVIKFSFVLFSVVAWPIILLIIAQYLTKN